MPYTKNPNIERVRMQAVRMVLSGRSTVETARHFGFAQGTIVKWVKKAEFLSSNAHTIPTISSRPQYHPRELPKELIYRIIELRKERNQCAEILHHRLMLEGIKVSLSSVKRVLRRYELTRFSRWKKWHTYPRRPLAEKPGILVEIDTIHDGSHRDRLYVYTMIDVCSRWAYALPQVNINTHRSLKFVREAKSIAMFRFQTIQSDHGPEFSKWFTKQIIHDGMIHRHSRVRKPNDNAHLERFNRTIQEECLDRIPRNLKLWRKVIPEYLRYYNTERPHMGLKMQTPQDILETIPSY